MNTSYSSTPRQAISTAAALAIMAIGGLTFDQAHPGTARAGIVEVGELTPVGVERLAQATLPEIVVTASRPSAQDPRFASDGTAHGYRAVAASGRIGQ